MIGTWLLLGVLILIVIGIMTRIAVKLEFKANPTKKEIHNEKV